MKRIIAAIVIVVLVIATGCSQKQKEIKAQATQQYSSVGSIEAFGVVKAKEKKNINIKFPAIVEKVNVVEGQKVKNGDVLVTLDISEYKAQLKNKESELKVMQHEIDVILASTNGSGPDIAKLNNDLRNAQEVYGKIKEELVDKEVLFNTGALSQYDFEEFKKSVDSKKKDVDDIKFSIGLLKDRKSIELVQKLSNFNILESEISLIKDNLNKSYLKDNAIVADIKNGVVYDIGYNQGDIIAKEKKAVSILDLDSLIIEADIAEEFIKDVKKNSEVTIIPTADKTKQYKGKVLRISDKAIKKDGETNILVEISIENNDNFILPDFNVDIKIEKSK